MQQLIKELEIILGCRVKKIDRFGSMTDESNADESNADEAKNGSDGKTYLEEASLLIGRQLSATEIELVKALIKNAKSEHEATAYHLLMDEQAHKRFQSTIQFPIHIWSIQFKDNYEEVEAVLKSVFENEITVKVSGREIVLFVSKAELTPYDLVEILEAEAYTSSKVAVSNLCVQTDEIYPAYQHLKELFAIGRQLKSNIQVITYESVILPMLVYSLKHPTIYQASTPGLILDAVMRHQIKPVGDEELEQTALSFFENNLNITETANKLFIHRNTLIYRLNKLESITGYDIRKFGDAINYYLNFIVDKIQ